jgi:FkbM family methyltransferase
MSLCFDIGSNKGAYIDANINKFKNFIAVEANPILYNNLLIKYKDLKNISILNHIVSDKKEEKFYICLEADTISTSDPDWVKNSRFSNSFNWKETEPISTISLDKCIEIYGFPDRIKIDVEGYELNVLKSLTRKVKEICFEWAEEKFEEILLSIEYLSSLRFSNFSIQIEDKYDFEPINFYSKNDIINWFTINCDKNRKNLWGMIWCR